MKIETKVNVERSVKFWMLGTLAATLGLGLQAQAQNQDSDLVNKVVHRTLQHQNAHNQANPRRGSTGITYHGGPLLGIAGGNPVNVYVIWYGNWSGNSATTIIPNFLNSIGGSPYYNINTTYYNGSGVHIQNAVNYSGSATDSYSQGKSLSDGQVQSIVESAITSNRLPKDSNAVYFVLTSADVTETSGFCSYYCGWHTVGTISGTNIKYAFVGNPDQCPSGCAAQYPNSPNGNAGADGMVSIIAHELEEAATDPDLNAWYDSRGEENADKCAWTFGTVYKAANGSYYNMTLGNNNYLIQRNWVNSGSGYCALGY